MRRWKFKTRNLHVELQTYREHGHQYDGHDPDGETQAKLDSGEYVAFASVVTVKLNGETIGQDTLCASVYAADEISQFWTAHRDKDPMNRNCTIMREAHPSGPNISICHYFPDMVRIACAEARQHLSKYPKVRTVKA